MKQTQGIHHITVVSSQAPAIAHFYERTLGMRMVKKTVNFDDDTAYHLYFGDGIGRPGTILTFFPYGDLPRHEMGRGMVQRIDMAIPEGSFAAWRTRLEREGVTTQAEFDAFGVRGLAFQDPDGLRLRLIETPGQVAEVWPRMAVEAGMAIRTAAGLRILATFAPRSSGHASAAEVLMDPLGFAFEQEANKEKRYSAPDGSYADVCFDNALPAGRRGAGYVHHVAFRAATHEDQLEIYSAMHELGLHVSPVQDRNYFQSIYAREPGGILYEVATDAPGFLIDEDFETLGTDLKLPPWFEARRQLIENMLPSLNPSVMQKG